MKHIHTYESFLNEANRSKRGNNKINFLKDSTSEVDHTRLVKWMGQNIDSNKYYFEKSKTVGYWILDVEKLSEIELKNLLGYLKSEKYKFGTEIWLPAYESKINEAVSQEAHYVHQITGCGQDAAQNFIDDNNIDAKKLADYVKQYNNSKEKYDVRDLIKDPTSNKKLLGQFVNGSKS